MTGLPKTIGELRLTEYRTRPVKIEIRDNAVARMRSGLPLVSGMVDYDDTVLPELERAILALHDVIFLGERGQGKTRLIRSLVELLDEWMPVIDGSELNDDPLNPTSSRGIEIVKEFGDETGLRWIHRSERYSEKLATPDTSIADLIGEVDPVKVAEGRYLADERTLHFGLVPRTNRGIFAINELPDLPERIQVGLLNLLEERDVQIRGYKIRLPLDLMFVASANPEDYTNRGRLITPLKDRFGTQIRTHYPLKISSEVEVMHQESDIRKPEGLDLIVPEFMSSLLATISQLARKSSSINQRSGVSVRMSVACYELLVASAFSRALRYGESEAVPRPSDLDAIVPGISGKIEIEGLDDSDEIKVIGRLISGATQATYRQFVEGSEVLDAQKEVEAEGFVVSAERSTQESYDVLLGFPRLLAASSKVAGSENRGVVVAASELILEGLHLAKRLNRVELDDGRAYSGR
ncbi:MAG: sigma 54-interacting transcriptional regulator [Acidimicrobiales bacterium]